MTAAAMIGRLQAMDPSGHVYVQTTDGKFLRVVDVTTSGLDPIYLPTTMLLQGVRYVREDASVREETHA